MRKMHDMDFINNRGFLIPWNRPLFVYTMILCCLLVVFTVPTQYDDLLYHDYPVKNVPLGIRHAMVFSLNSSKAKQAFHKLNTIHLVKKMVECSNYWLKPLSQ